MVIWDRLAATPAYYWPIYATLYLSAGFFAQTTAHHTRVARFARTWQVATLYGLFLIPLSAVLRGRPWHEQFAYAVAAIGPIDVLGFSLGTSLAYPGNVIEQVVGVRNFTLAFVLIAAWIPFIGNTVVEAIAHRLVGG